MATSERLLSRFVTLTLLHAILLTEATARPHFTTLRHSEHSLKLTPEQINAADELRAEQIQRKALLGNPPRITEGDSKVLPEGATLTRSGLDIGTPNYVVSMALGTPLQNLTFIIDTGSDLTWAQCLPCDSCYDQRDPIFDGASSSTYNIVDCSDEQKCTTFLGAYRTLSRCEGKGNPCTYQESYLDGSISEGDFVTDSALIYGATAKPVSYSFGCGHFNKGTMSGYAGVLAFSRDLLSYPSQTNLSSFSHCLPAPYSTPGDGFLVFNPAGDTVSDAGTICTDVVYTKQSGLYLVDLLRFTIMPSRLPRNHSGDDSGGLVGPGMGPGMGASPGTPPRTDTTAAGTGTPPDYTEIKTFGKPNIMILDTGTLITRLKGADYIALRSAVVDATAHFLTPAPDVLGYDTCYTYSSVSDAIKKRLLPEITLVFNGTSSGPNGYVLPPNSIFYRWTNNTSCFAFKPTTTGWAILGNNHMQGRNFTYDISKSRCCFQSQGTSCK